jgi:hypothetical protein
LTKFGLWRYFYVAFRFSSFIYHLIDIGSQKSHNFPLLFCIHYSSFHQSSDSRSESGTCTQKSTKLKSGEESDNTGSNHEDDIGSIGLNVMDGNDNGSGTQVLLTFFLFFIFLFYFLVFGK